MSRNYDIFISYRRDGAEQTAKAIYDKLTSKGYYVFYDIETLRSGDFNKELYSKIERCKDFILILPPKGLDRCVDDEGDWVRLEIEHALKHKKNIIPVMLRGFEFPEFLPKAINEIRFQNGIQASIEYFDGFIRKLTKFFKSRKSIFKVFEKLSILRKTIAIFMFLITTFILWWIGAGVYYNLRYQRPYPNTVQEQQDVDTLLVEIQMIMNDVDFMNMSVDLYMDYCEQFINQPDLITKDALKKSSEELVETLESYTNESREIDKDLLGNLRTSPINAVNFKLSYKIPSVIAQGHIESINAIKVTLLEENNIAVRSEQEKLLDIMKENREVTAQSVILMMNMLTLPIDENYLYQFKTQILTQYYTLSKYANLWTHNSVELEVDNERLETQKKNLNLEMLAIIEDVKQRGFEHDSNENVTDNLDVTTQDNSETLWFNAVQLIDNEMYDEAIEAFEYFYENVEMENKDAFIPPVISFVKNIEDSGIDYGVVVIGYEQGKPRNSVYEIGDIVTEINGEECKTVQDVADIEARIGNGECYVTIFRLTEDGGFERIEMEIPRGESMVCIASLGVN